MLIALYQAAAYLLAKKLEQGQYDKENEEHLKYDLDNYSKYKDINIIAYL